MPDTTTRPIRQWTTALLCAIITTLPIQTDAVSLKRADADHKLYWRGISDLYHNGTQISIAMLLRETEIPLNTDNVTQRLRINWNAHAIFRLSRAYLYFIGELNKHFPNQKQQWQALRTQWQKFKQAAKTIKQNAINGKTAPKAIQQLKQLQRNQWKPFKGPKRFTKAQLKTLNECFTELGTGAELLAYYRMRQIAGLLTSTSNKQKQRGKNAYKRLIARLDAHQKHFRNLKAKRKKKAGLQLFLYHISQTKLVAKRLLQHTQAPKNAKRKAAYQIAHLRLRNSLAKANSSFNRLWKPAKGE